MAANLYAVVDTNVLVSALISKNPVSYPLRVVASVYDGSLIPVYNKEILAEYKAVLSRKKFNLNTQDMEDALRVITDFGLELDRTPVKDEEFPDKQDIVFYEVRMSKEDSYLVTGNIKHFPKKPFVVTPKEMVEILTKQRD